MVKVATHTEDEVKHTAFRVNKIVSDYLAEANVSMQTGDTVSMNSKPVELNQPVPDNSVLVVAPRAKNG